MALFKKKTEDLELKKQQEAQLKLKQEQKMQTLNPFEIHVMPQKFMGDLQSASQSAGKKSRVGLVLIVVVVIIALLGVGAWQLYLALNPKVAPVITANQTVNIAPVNNVAVNVTPVNNVPVNNEPVNNAPINNVAVNNVPVNNAPVNNTPINNAPVNEPAVALQPSLDVDRDGLTDVEEGLYGTQLRLPDTDGDGFVDGQELLSGYSPLSSGPIQLKDTALMNTYIDPTFGYSLLYPSSWLSRPTDESRREILFVSSTGEVMMLEVKDNPDKSSLTQWMVTNQAGVPSDYTEFKTRSNLSGLANANLMKYFVDEPVSGKVYVFTYQLNGVTRPNFQTTLRAMVNSFAAK